MHFHWYSNFLGLLRSVMKSFLPTPQLLRCLFSSKEQTRTSHSRSAQKKTPTNQPNNSNNKNLRQTNKKKGNRKIKQQKASSGVCSVENAPVHPVVLCLQQILFPHLVARSLSHSIPSNQNKSILSILTLNTEHNRAFYLNLCEFFILSNLGTV